MFPVALTDPPDGRMIERTNWLSDNNFVVAHGRFGQLRLTTMVLDFELHRGQLGHQRHQSDLQPVHRRRRPVTGVEVQFNVTFRTPFVLGPDHVFFRPEVERGSAGNFLWLSAPKPLLPPRTPFTPVEFRA